MSIVAFKEQPRRIKRRSLHGPGEEHNGAHALEDQVLYQFMGDATKEASNNDGAFPYSARGTL